MLSKRDNFIETVSGGNPDRFVNQFEYWQCVRSPFTDINTNPKRGEMDVVNAWGVTQSWREDQPGAFPNHSPEKILVKDITHWRDYVTAPPNKFSEAQWDKYLAQAETVDTNDVFLGFNFSPGILEQCHYFTEITNCMINFYEEPEAMHDLIKFLTEWELGLAEDVCSHTHPELLFHHDDWGSQNSTFMSVDMFEEFFLEAYQQVYGYYKDHGVKYIVHHSDSYGITLVPTMIKMGIDVWQGALSINNLPDLIAKYGDQIAFMGGIDSNVLDKADWSREEIDAYVRKTCADCGSTAFIPCLTRGAGGSVFAGVYDAVTESIDAFSKEYFK